MLTVWNSKKREKECDGRWKEQIVCGFCHSGPVEFTGERQKGENKERLSL